MTIFAAPRFKGASRLNGGLFQSATIAAAMASGVLTGPLAHAQEASASSGQLDEIVVTARATAEKEVAVPISVQTFSENQLREENITDLGSLQFLAGFTFQNATSTAGGGREFPALICRGLQSTYGGGFQDSCALFVDGNFVSAGIASITTSDVAQVEVLKGPQNVYFGKNTFGGAINFITAKPTDYFGGQIDASVTGRGSNKVDATLEGPLVAGILDGRIEFENYNKAAQYMASDGGQLGAERSTSVTTALAFTPNDDLLVRFRGHYQQDNDSAADTAYLPGSVYGTTCNAGNGTTSGGVHVPITLSGPYFCGTIPSLAQTGTSVLNVNTTIPAPFAQSLATNNFGGVKDPILAEAPSLGHSGLRRNLLQLGAQATYDLPYDAVFALNAGYNSSQSLDIWDLDRTANAIFLNAQPILSQDVTFDARVTSDQSASLRGVIGANFFRSTYATDQDDDNFYGYGPLAFLYSGTSVQTGNYINEDDSIWAVYGSVDYDIFDFLTVTAEARYQHDVVTDYTYGAAGSYSKSFNNILPRAIIKYHPEPDWNFYASWSEGVQPAQLQSSYISATAPQRAYLAKYFPDVNYFTPLPKLYSWEIGAKQRLFDNKFQYGIALYDERWDHQQTSTALFNPAGCGGTQFTAACPLSTGGIGLNLSNTAQIRGVEFNAAAQLLPQLTVDGSIDYKHAVWLDYFNSTYAAFTGGATNFNGNAIARVPDLTGQFQAVWRDHLVGDWEYYIRGQMTYQGGMYESDIDIGRTASFERVNGSIGVQEGDLTLELYVINLTNDKNWDWASRVPELENATDLFTGYETYQGVLVGAPDKRDFGFKVHYKFGAPEAAPATAQPAYVPPPVVAPTPASARSYMVFFDFNKSDLTSQAVAIVDQAAANAGPAKVTQLVVTGHTDTVGSDAYNMRLSRRRAESVAAELEKKGIPSSEIEIVAKGKKDLLVPTADGVREPQNRRVQIVYEGGATS